MALKDLYSDLSTSGYPNHEDTSLKYGAGSPIFDGVFESNTLEFGKGTAFDRPDQGFSNQPFVTSERINTNIVDSFSDGLVRGGIVTATARSIKDVERITKFLLTPQGLGFLTKQVGLQKSNPVIFDDNNDQRTYNLGLNTLASVASSATGIRFKREGRIPFSDPTAFSGYNTGIGIRKEGDDNRLIQLFKGHISLEETPDNQFKLLEYKGGPKSLYGLGQTTINKYTHYNTLDKEFNYKEQILDIGGISGLGVNVESLLTSDKEQREFKDLKEYTKNSDVRVGPKGSKILLQSNPNYRNRESSKFPHKPSITSKQENKYNTLDTEFNDKPISTYHVSYNGESDAINLKPIQQNQQVYEVAEDFIPFRFEAVNTENPLKSDYIIFRAFLDSFNDNFNANHNSFNYNGRGETFYTYNGFTRNIDFSFKIAAQSKDEMRPLYKKLNYLLSNTAPEYSSVGRMRTPFIKLTVGDWCNRVPGVLNAITLSWQKDYPWDLGEDPNSSGLILPHVLDVQVQFTPVHQFMPEKSHLSSEDNTLFINTPFINA